MSRLTRRSTSIAAGLLATFALIAVGAGAVGAAPKAKGKADSGTVFFALTHSTGTGNKTINHAAGDSVDHLFGAGAVTYDLKIVPTSGTIAITVPKVTEFFSNGSLTGTAKATLTITNSTTGDATITKGTLNEPKGGGGQKGHSFKATFSGNGNIKTGSYKITYKGTYK